MHKKERKRTGLQKSGVTVPVVIALTFLCSFKAKCPGQVIKTDICFQVIRSYQLFYVFSSLINKGSVLLLMEKCIFKVVSENLQ